MLDGQRAAVVEDGTPLAGCLVAGDVHRSMGALQGGAGICADVHRATGQGLVVVDLAVDDAQVPQRVAGVGRASPAFMVT